MVPINKQNLQYKPPHITYCNKWDGINCMSTFVSVRVRAYVRACRVLCVRHFIIITIIIVDYYNNNYYIF